MVRRYSLLLIVPPRPTHRTLLYMTLCHPPHLLLRPRWQACKLRFRNVVLRVLLPELDAHISEGDARLISDDRAPRAQARNNDELLDTGESGGLIALGKGEFVAAVVGGPPDGLTCEHSSARQGKGSEEIQPTSAKVEVEMEALFRALQDRVKLERYAEQIQIRLREDRAICSLISYLTGPNIVR